MRRVSKLQWHPEAATQVMVACGDDASTVVQLWDLRYASAPTLELQEHTKASLAGRGARVRLDCTGSRILAMQKMQKRPKSRPLNPSY